MALPRGSCTAFIYFTRVAATVRGHPERRWCAIALTPPFTKMLSWIVTRPDAGSSDSRGLSANRLPSIS